MNSKIWSILNQANTTKTSHVIVFVDKDEFTRTAEEYQNVYHHVELNPFSLPRCFNHGLIIMNGGCSSLPYEQEVLFYEKRARETKSGFVVFAEQGVEIKNATKHII